MSQATAPWVAGIDAGTECIKVYVANGAGKGCGQSVLPTRGYFQDSIQEALGSALDEAGITATDLQASAVTGFGASCSPLTSMVVSEAGSHARGAVASCRGEATLVDLGGRFPQLIHISAESKASSTRNVRKCAAGVGTFLMFAARQLDVHPTRLMDLTSAAEGAASVGSYCSVFAEIDVIERLRNGDSIENIALGCMHSVAERVLEIGTLRTPVYACGGVCEYFPGVVHALADKAGVAIEVIPQPIFNAARGAALLALDSLIAAKHKDTDASLSDPTEEKTHA